MDKKQAIKIKRRRSLINLAGGLLLVTAAGLLVFLLMVESDDFQGWYMTYQTFMENLLREHVLGLGDFWLILGAVLLLYALRSFLPVPIFVLAAITGAILPTFLSIAYNVGGLMILFSIRYHWGRRRNGGYVKRLITRQQDIADYIEHGKGSKAWLLFILRLLPNFALNQVSIIYGGMKFDHTDFILISLAGYLPKLISYTILGNNVATPLESGFVVPLIIMCTLLGVSIICVNMAMTKIHATPKKEVST